MITIYRRTHAKNEEGIALLFTLGILSLLLVLALSFATTTSIERKSAEVNNDVAVARMLADSAFERVMAGLSFAMSKHAQNPEGLPSGMVVGVSKTQNIPVSAADDDNVDGKIDMIYPGDGLNLSNSVFETSTVNGYLDNYYQYDSADNIEWSYITDKSEDLDEDGNNDLRIMGRYAYVVVSDGRKLTPEACSSQLTSVERYGINVNEVNLHGIESLTPSDLSGLKTYSDNYLADFSSTDAATRANPRKISDYSTFAADNFTPSHEGLFKDTMSIPGAPGPNESFWIDDNGDTKVGSGNTEQYNRFWLRQGETQLEAQAAWDAMTVDRLTSPPTKFGTTNTGGIPWLEIKNDDTEPEKNLKRQIAANIIDYCDSDDFATTDGVLTDTGWSTPPTYMGNEKNSTVARCRFALRCKVEKKIPDPSTPTIFDYEVKWAKIGFSILTANLHNLSDTEKAEYTMRASFTCSYEMLNGNNSYETFTFDSSDISSESAGKYPTYMISADYAFLGHEYFFDDIAGDALSKVYGIEGKYKMRNVKFSDVHFYLYHGDGSDPATLVDYGHILASAANWDILNGDIQESNNQDLVYNMKQWFEVQDPRHNKLTPDLWTSYNQNPQPSPLEPNLGSHPETGDDTESSVVMDVSTAYIRNTPMVSPWELGLIHRGKQWQTLNLNKYNKDSDYLVIDDPSDPTDSSGYDLGDANILDQIKMGAFLGKPADFDYTSPALVDSIYSYGAVPLNTQTPEVLQALFYDVKYGCELKLAGNPIENGAKLTHEDALQIADEIVEFTGDDDENKGPFKNRGEVTDIISNEIATIANAHTWIINDAAQEEIIGKTINLCSLSGRADTFTIIAVAQSIRDVGGIANGININTVPDCKIGQYDRGADIILSEQKVMAVVTQRTNLTTAVQEWVILKYMYLED